MNKPYKTLLVNILLVVIVFMYSTINVNATSWIKLEPEEVSKRAEIIVYGKYDFSKSMSKTQQYKGIFSPITFKVDKYYRGSGAEVITTGIDMYDIGWVQEVQEEGALFLLFLERDKENKDFLIPIAGPNGMIQVINNKAKTGNENEEAYFNNILLKQTASSPSSKSQSLVLISTGILVLLILIVIIVIRTIKSTRLKQK